MLRRDFSQRLILVIIILGCLFLSLPLVSAQGNKKTSQPLELELNSLRIENQFLKKRLKGVEREKIILEAILGMQIGPLRQPGLVSQDEKLLDKIIHLNLGFAYGTKGKVKKAITEYKKALDYNPLDKDIHYNLGYLFSKQNKYKEAIEEYKKAISGLPEDNQIYYNLAIIYATALKDQKTAQEYYKKSLSQQKIPDK